MFRNVGKQQSDAGEIPKRIHTRIKTRRKFEIKKRIRNCKECNLKILFQYFINLLFFAPRTKHIYFRPLFISYITPILYSSVPPPIPLSNIRAASTNLSFINFYLVCSFSLPFIINTFSFMNICPGNQHFQKQHFTIPYQN